MKQKTKTSKQSKENQSKAKKKTKPRQKIYIFKHEVICGSFSPQFKWSITLKGLRPFTSRTITIKITIKI